MKPVAFDYYRPETLSDALDLLRQLGDEAKLLAGGQSLVPMMNFRFARPSALIDLNRIVELTGVRSEDGVLAVGSMTRQWDLETSDAVHEGHAILREALAKVGHTATRTRGTVGGSLAHADATAELPVVAVALDAEVVIASDQPQNLRVVAAEDFFLFHYTTALEAGDVLTEVRFPVLAPREGAAFEELAHRHGDFAIVAVAATVELEGDRCRRARIALGGVAPRPIRAEGAEASVLGRPVTSETWRRAAEAAAAEIDPDDDPQIPAGYRRDVARELTARALERAAKQAQGGA